MNHFEELQNHYEKWLHTLGFSQSVVYGYPKMLHYFFEHLKSKGIYHITQLTNSHLYDYFNYLQTRPNMRSNTALSISHLNKNFDAVDKFLEFLHSGGCTQNIPSPTCYRILETRNAKDREVTVLSKEEIKILYSSTEKLLSHFTLCKAEPRRALAILILDLCYGCGLRKSEAFNLLTEDIDFDKKILFIRQAKGYKDRYVPMHDSVSKRIETFIYRHRREFNTKHKRVFPLTSKESMFHYIKLLRTASGLNKNFGLHTLRHSIATHLLQNGMSIEQIAKFLGHSSLESTQVYTHLINDEQ
jgi:integrase/recombinase XerD